MYVTGKNNLDIFLVLMVADDAFPAKILVLLSTSVDRFGVSRTRDFLFNHWFKSYSVFAGPGKQAVPPSHKVLSS